MNNLGEMTALVRVIEAGGFSAASRRMRVSVSALSRQVMQLEDRLGARLLQRTTRRIALTEEGRAYYERARRILADIAETELAVQSAHAAPSGTLRINMSSAFGRSQVVPLLPEFLQRYPEVRVELTFTDTIVDLVEDGADVAIRIANLADSRLIARRLADNRRLICAAPSYIARAGEPRTPGELARHNCLVSTAAPQLNVWEFEATGGAERIEVNGNVGGNVSDTLYQLCLAGVGIMRLPEFLVGPDIKAGRLVPLLTRQRQPESPPIWAVYPERRHLSPKVRVFVDFVAAKFIPTPPWQCNFPL
jgi:DNA-binding transcriptional LysR family regulator